MIPKVSDNPGKPFRSSDVPRERHIRCALETWLLTKHAGDPTTAIIHELEIPRPSGRIDVALINGRLAGYEIKSAVDSLARLSTQEPSFSSVFERMTLVVTDRHVKSALASVPSWWEILEAEADGFRVRRPGRANPSLDLENVLHVLTRVELLRLEIGLQCKGGSATRRKSAIIGSIVSAGRAKPTISLVKQILKERATCQSS